MAFVATGCIASHSEPSRGPVVDVTVRDFALSAPPRAHAGDVTLRVHNKGPDDHEMIVVRGGDKLPLRDDGITIDEDAIEDATVVALEPVEPGTTTDLHVHLTPGKYQMFCNMSGHYMGGMSATVTVG
jgi:uncharacterized cupredoxin-like copper-binding protein